MGTKLIRCKTNQLENVRVNFNKRSLVVFQKVRAGAYWQTHAHLLHV